MVQLFFEMLGQHFVLGENVVFQIVSAGSLPYSRQ